MGYRVGVVRLSRRAHNPETGGSNPPLDTKTKFKLKVKKVPTKSMFFFFSLSIIIRGLLFIHILSNAPQYHKRVIRWQRKLRVKI